MRFTNFPVLGIKHKIHQVFKLVSAFQNSEETPPKFQAQANGGWLSQNPADCSILYVALNAGYGPGVRLTQAVLLYGPSLLFHAPSAGYILRFQPRICHTAETRWFLLHAALKTFQLSTQWKTRVYVLSLSAVRPELAAAVMTLPCCLYDKTALGMVRPSSPLQLV